MKINTAIIAIGIIMTSTGLVAFILTQDTPSTEPELRMINHGGAFTGLLGIGATIAGFLLYVINKYQVPV